MSQDGRLLSRNQLTALLLSLVAGIVLYLMVSIWGGWSDIVRAFQAIGLLGCGIVLLLSLLNYALRFLRWQLYLHRLNYSVPFWASLRIYLSGFSLTTTPGKAGEAMRGLFLQRYDVPFSTSLSLLISERLSDLIAIVVLALLGLRHYPNAHFIIYLGIGGIALVLLMLSSERLLDRLAQWSGKGAGKGMKLVHSVIIMLQTTRRCHTLPIFSLTLLLSLFAWGAEALGFYWVLQWLELDISLELAASLYALSMLAGALSFLPGGLGGAELVMISLLKLEGMATPLAVATTIFIRLATLWFAVIIGVFALIHHSLIKERKDG